MTLEMEQIEIAKTHLVDSGWEAGAAFDPEADAELMEEDKIEAAKREERNQNAGWWTCALYYYACSSAEPPHQLCRVGYRVYHPPR